MKAQDLRLGNRVLYKDFKEIDEWTEIAIGFGDFNFMETGEIDVHYKPIPLTEEWLEKFGFEKQDSYYYQPNSHGDFELYQNGASWGIGIDNYVDVRLCKFIDLLYVHDLQNFWFAVTGFELTIKETVKA